MTCLYATLIFGIRNYTLNVVSTAGLLFFFLDHTLTYAYLCTTYILLAYLFRQDLDPSSEILIVDSPDLMILR
jgi:hypothetical protein